MGVQTQNGLWRATRAIQSQNCCANTALRDRFHGSLRPRYFYDNSSNIPGFLRVLSRFSHIIWTYSRLFFTFPWRKRYSCVNLLDLKNVQLMVADWSVVSKRPCMDLKKAGGHGDTLSPQPLRTWDLIPVPQSHVFCRRFWRWYLTYRTLCRWHLKCCDHFHGSLWKAKITDCLNVQHQDLRVLNFILEMKVKYGENWKTIHLSQGAYIRQVLARYIMDQVKPAPTPMTKSANEVFKKWESRWSHHLSLSRMHRESNVCINLHSPGHIHYSKYLCSICVSSYIWTCTCREADSSLSSVLSRPWNPLHRNRTWHAVAGLCRCRFCQWSEHTTLGIRISLHAERTSILVVKTATLRIYKPHLVWCRRISTMFEDYQATIALAISESITRRWKHIDVRHHQIRELIQKGILILRYCETDQNLADIMQNRSSLPDCLYFAIKSWRPWLKRVLEQTYATLSSTHCMHEYAEIVRVSNWSKFALVISKKKSFCYSA